MHFPRPARIVLTLAVVAVLSACAPAAELVPSAAATPTPTPAATPTPTTSPLPTLAFDGDCSTMVDAGVLGAAIGVSYAAPEDWANAGVRTLGGTSCTWTPEGIAPGVRADALPYDVVPADVKQRYSDVVCEGYDFDRAGCRLAVADDETWILLTVDELFWSDEGQIPEDVAEARAREQLVAVTPLFQRSLPAAGSPAPAARTSAWWGPVTCDELEALVPIASVVGGEVRDGYPAGFGRDVLDKIADAAGTRIDCMWHAFVGEEMNAVLVTAYPGGGWDFEEASTRAAEHGDLSPVTVDGATKAIAGIGGLRENSSALMATDGVNLLWQIEAPDAASAAAAIMAALSSAG